jgi:hypothetical protein
MEKGVGGPHCSSSCANEDQQWSTFSADGVWEVQVRHILLFKISIHAFNSFISYHTSLQKVYRVASWSNRSAAATSRTCVDQSENAAAGEVQTAGDYEISLNVWIPYLIVALKLIFEMF